MYIQYLYSVGTMAMNDRRGHGKLRLTSRKHFKPKPKRSTKGSIISDTVPAISLSLCVSLPLSVYTNAPLMSLDMLSSRLKKCDAIPSGN